MMTIKKENFIIIVLIIIIFIKLIKNNEISKNIHNNNDIKFNDNNNNNNDINNNNNDINNNNINIKKCNNFFKIIFEINKFNYLKMKNNKKMKILKYIYENKLFKNENELCKLNICFCLKKYKKLYKKRMINFFKKLEIETKYINDLKKNIIIIGFFFLNFIIIIIRFFLILF
jgi:hypothetical protein